MIRGPLSIDEQTAAMATTWPKFQLVQREGNAGMWSGPLRPLFQTFWIQILYRAPSVIEAVSLRDSQPRVKIITPQLRPRRNDPEGLLPHVYYGGSDIADVFLCMFDPESNEWSPNMSLAETTVPWTIDWLASYEGWRATGVWTGGGKHLDNPVLAPA